MFISGAETSLISQFCMVESNFKMILEPIQDKLGHLVSNNVGHSLKVQSWARGGYVESPTLDVLQV
jgi:hypothetical protein